MKRAGGKAPTCATCPRLAGLEEIVGELRRSHAAAGMELGQMRAVIGRLAEAATVQGLRLERLLAKLEAGAGDGD